MTELFRNQLLHELSEAGYHQAKLADDDKSIIPVPEYPELRISPDHVRYGLEATEAERELAHWDMVNIQQRTIDACSAWDNSREMPGEHMGAENFRLLSEFNDVVLAARNDGMRGLHFVTWDYSNDRTSLMHGHYTTSFAGALEDYASRAGMVKKEQIIDPANAPMLYRALQTVSNNYWLSNEQADQVKDLCQQLRQLDHAVADKAESIEMDPADLYMPGETMEPEMDM